MSKVRRDKHKALVFLSQIDKALDRIDMPYTNQPRWRQSAKAHYEYVIRELKNEQN